MGLISKHLCKHTVCTCGTYAKMHLMTPQGHLVQLALVHGQFLHFCGIKCKIWLKFQNLKHPN